MSWTFAGISFKTKHPYSYPYLLGQLDLAFSNAAEGFTFSDAIDSENKAYALGRINTCTMLVNEYLSYDCSFEANGMNPLDEKLQVLSKDQEILVYIFDGKSETYCFAYFKEGKRIRRWAKDPSRLLCNDGEVLDMENQHPVSPADLALPPTLQPGKDALILLSVWESFHEVQFQELVQSKNPGFTFFL